MNCVEPIFCPPWPSLYIDKLSIDERDSDGFISRLVACSSSCSSYNLTDSSDHRSLSLVP